MAARPRSSTRWLGLLSTLGVGLGVGSACSEPCEGRRFTPPPEPDPSASGPPQVIAGEWIGSGVLELSFSKPLTSNGDLDPARFAIVGWTANARGYSGVNGECYLQTRYSELGIQYSYYYSQGSGIAAAWIGPEDDTLLRLRLANSASQCQSPNGSLASGVMLAYTNASDPSLGEQLRDENGNPLPDIGPAWAIQDLDSCLNGYFCGSVGYYSYGHLPQLDSLVAIPCP